MTSRPIAFLDADVLSAPLSRTLILVSAAHEDARFVFRWSRAVEVEADRHARPGQALVSSLHEVLDWDTMLVADASEDDAARLIDTSQKDRHVLAAAQCAGARVVVTRNVTDFGVVDLRQGGLVAAHPDLFLAITMSVKMYAATLQQMSSARTRPPDTPEMLHAAISAGHPRLFERMAAAFPDVDPLSGDEAPPNVVFRGDRCLLCGAGLSSAAGFLCPNCQTGVD